MCNIVQNIKYIEHFVKKHDTIVLSKVKRLDKLKKIC